MVQKLVAMVEGLLEQIYLVTAVAALVSNIGRKPDDPLIEKHSPNSEGLGRFGGTFFATGRGSAPNVRRQVTSIRSAAYSAFQ